MPVKKILFVTLFATLAAFGFAQHLQVHVETVMDDLGSAIPKISFAKEVHDFGQIAHNVPVEVEFEFTNTGNAPLKIIHVKASCGCTATDYPQDPISPGASATITASYNAKTKGAFTKTITVTTNSEEGDKVLKIRGFVE